jgi:hypothetical protein
MKLSFLAIAIMVLGSCSQEVLPETEETKDRGLVEITLNAFSESDEGETKVTFVNYPKLGWQKNDKISLLGTNTVNEPLTASTAGNNTQFTGYGSKFDDVYYALYPYDENVRVSSEGVFSGVVVPAVQTATAGTFDPNAYVAIAKSEDRENLYFKGVGTFLKFNINAFAGKTVKSITVMGNNNEVMAGKSTATKFNNNGGVDHSSVDNSTASYSVKLQGTFDTGKAYFMIVRPQPYNKGVTVYVELGDGTVLSRKGSTNLFNPGEARNSILTLTLDPNYFTEVTDLYSLYELGYDINVGGKVFNKTNSTATHITKSSASKAIGASGVYFVDSDVTATLGTNFSQVAIIGNDPTKRSTVTRSGYYKIAASANEDYLIISGINLSIDPNTTTYSIRVEGNNTCELISFENCNTTIETGDFTKSCQYIYAAANNYIKNLIVKDSEFIVEANADNNFLNLNALQTVEKITFDNNVFYTTAIAEPSKSFNLVAAANATVTDCILNKNTFYGAYPAAGGSSITNCKSTNMTITNNMFGVRSDATANSSMVGAKISGNMNITNNASYKNGTSFTIGGVAGTYMGTGTAESPKSVGIYTTNWNPSVGKFTIHNDYGATR